MAHLRRPHEDRGTGWTLAVWAERWSCRAAVKSNQHNGKLIYGRAVKSVGPEVSQTMEGWFLLGSSARRYVAIRGSSAPSEGACTDEPVCILENRSTPRNSQTFLAHGSSSGTALIPAIRFSIGKTMNLKASGIWVVVATALMVSPAANAKGCIKGAVAGAVAGHYAGHHAAVGAVGGCAVGRHLAHKKTAEEQAQAASAAKPAAHPPLRT